MTNLSNKKWFLLILTLVFSYSISLLIFFDFKIINVNYYLRLIFPTVIVTICLYFCRKSIKIIADVDREEHRIYRILLLLVIVFLGILMISSIKIPALHFDTWQIYDTSRYVFKDFGRMDMIRQHIINTPYQIAFPPLYPFLMALFNLLFNFGVFAAVIINFIVCYMLLYFLIKIGTLLNRLLVSIIVSVLLLFNPEMVSCFLGGSTLPINILFFLISSYIILKKVNDFNYSNVVALALISGLGVLNRFDYLPIAISLGIFIMIINKKVNVLHTIVFFIIILLTISPWIIYSKIHFNSIFITDNGRRLFNILDTRPTTFFSLTNPALTVFDNPFFWFRESFNRWLSATKGLYSIISNYTYFKESVFVFIFLIVLNNIRIKSNAGLLKNCFSRNKAVLILLLSGMIQIVPIILTGYPDSRYYIIFSFTINYVLLYTFFGWLFKNESDGNVLNKPMLIIILVICIITPKLGIYTIEKTAYRFVQLFITDSQTTRFLTMEDNLDVYNYIVNVNNNPRIIINREETTMDIPRFAALSNQVTTLSPSNLSLNNAEEFVGFFELNYLYSSDEEQVEIFKETINVTPLEIENLYYLELRK